ncbi:MAG: TatD family hydrolase, partial [bacterium]|nr:TatD family hydrolase [bacterium]
MLIDSHCHLNFRAFRDDADKVIKETLKAETWMILPGSQRSTSERAVHIAESYPKGVYAAVGLHPVHLTQRNITAQEVQAGATTT